MQITINGQLYIVKFYYGEVKPYVDREINSEVATKSVGTATLRELKDELKRREENKRLKHAVFNRTTKCVISKAVSEKDSVEFAKAEIKNHVNDQFIRAEGRLIAFKRVLVDLITSKKITSDEMTEFMKAFYKACPKSRPNALGAVKDRAELQSVTVELR